MGGLRFKHSDSIPGISTPSKIAKSNIWRFDKSVLLKRNWQDIISIFSLHLFPTWCNWLLCYCMIDYEVVDAAAKRLLWSSSEMYTCSGAMLLPTECATKAVAL